MPHATVHYLSGPHADLVYALAEHGPQPDHKLVRRIAMHANPGRRPHNPQHPWTWQADSTVRTRRSELVKWGIVLEQPGRAQTAAGKPTRVWALAEPMPLSVPLPPLNLEAFIEHLHARRAEASGNLVIGVALADLARAAGGAL